jgi:hypothetical protein
LPVTSSTFFEATREPRLKTTSRVPGLLANPIASFVEYEVGEFSGLQPNIGAEGDRHLLAVPLHDVERYLDELFVRKVLAQRCDRFISQRRGLRHQRVGQIQCSLLMPGEPRSVTFEHLVDGCLVESLIPGNCQAYGQSRTAVVMVSTPHTHDLGGDGINGVQSNRCRRYATHAASQCRSEGGACCDSTVSFHAGVPFSLDR